MLLTNFSAQDAYVVTPSDTVDLPNGVCKGIYIGDAAAANVKVMMQGGEAVTFANVIPGQVLPIAVKRVYSTSTTATDIIALY